MPNPEVVPPEPPEITQPETQIDPPDVDPRPRTPEPVEPRDVPPDEPRDRPPVSPENQPLEERDA